MERVKELEEVNAIADELGENQDNYVKELNDDLANKDVELFNLQQNVEQLEELALE